MEVKIFLLLLFDLLRMFGFMCNVLKGLFVFILEFELFGYFGY